MKDGKIVHIICNTHWDREWYLPFQQFRIKLAKMIDIAGALSVEVLKGTDTAFDERIHELRPHPGQMATAKNQRRLMAGSEIRESHRYNDPRVQDAHPAYLLSLGAPRLRDARFQEAPERIRQGQT